MLSQLSRAALRPSAALRQALGAAPARAESTMAFTGAQRVLTNVKSMLPRIVTSGVVIHGEPVLYVDPPNIPTVMEFLKNHSELRCKQLVDMTAVDVPSRERRFEVRLPLALRTEPEPCTSLAPATLTDRGVGCISAAFARPQQPHPRQDAGERP